MDSAAKPRRAFAQRAFAAVAIWPLLAMLLVMAAIQRRCE